MQSWNTIGYTPLQIGRVSWSVAGQIRVRDGVSDVHDRIFGTLFSVDAGKGVTVSGGYLMRHHSVIDIPAIVQHRVSAGVGYPVYVRGDLRLNATTIYERHLTSPPIPDYNRYRQRFELGLRRTGFSPTLYEDLAILQSSGLYRSRSRAGVQWKGANGYTLSVQYQFETINLPGSHTWYPVHSIVTDFNIDKPMWKSKR